ncbi:S-adenosyl-L-methionine-dependent methyltransferase, partial [Thamnocephalis sphaerospora]
HSLLKNPRRTLDVGTGAGTWLLEMASEFPECEFTGISVAPLQSTAVFPPNCRLQSANILEGIPHPNGHFDYVHHRFLVLAMPSTYWESYVNECARVCASGGWIEMFESDFALYEAGPASKKMNIAFAQAFAAQGVITDVPNYISPFMRDAGLVDFSLKEYQIPVGAWGGMIGELFWNNFVAIFNTLRPLLVARLRMTNEEIDQMLVNTHREIQQCRAYLRGLAYTARKR